MPAATPAVGGVHEDALSCVLHHVGFDLLHHLHSSHHVGFMLGSSRISAEADVMCHVHTAVK